MVDDSREVWEFEELMNSPSWALTPKAAVRDAHAFLDKREIDRDDVIDVVLDALDRFDDEDLFEAAAYAEQELLPPDLQDRDEIMWYAEQAWEDRMAKDHYLHALHLARHFGLPRDHAWTAAADGYDHYLEVGEYENAAEIARKSGIGAEYEQLALKHIFLDRWDDAEENEDVDAFRELKQFAEEHGLGEDFVRTAQQRVKELGGYTLNDYVNDWIAGLNERLSHAVAELPGVGSGGAADEQQSRRTAPRNRRPRNRRDRTRRQRRQ